MKKTSIETHILKIRTIANSGQYKKALALIKRLQKHVPDNVLLKHYEAVMFGDDENGRSSNEIKKRHKKAALMMKPLLKRLREVPTPMRLLMKNEYYWFSHQPKKQYQLGVLGVVNGNRRSYYSQGVGAVEVARLYREQRRHKLSVRWAKKAERAWRLFFKVDANWYNSYCWYAKALLLQGRVNEMEAALRRAAKISGKPIHDPEFKEVRKMLRPC